MPTDCNSSPYLQISRVALYACISLAIFDGATSFTYYKLGGEVDDKSFSLRKHVQGQGRYASVEFLFCVLCDMKLLFPKLLVKLRQWQWSLDLHPL